MNPRWRIYYGDGSTYGSQDGSPFGAPGGNAQVICNERDDGSAPPLSGHNLYRWNGETWTGCDWCDLGQYYLAHPGPQKVILGYETLTREAFNRILERAIREKLG